MLRALTLLAGVGTVLAIGHPVAHYAQTASHEQAAISRLEAVAAAQRAFRDRGGRGGYATSLESLTTPCPGVSDRNLDALAEGGEFAGDGYRVALRAARDAALPVGDCHGRPTAADFVASALPIRPGVDGVRSMSVMASGRVFLFFDAVPPAEEDIAPGGLAVSLDAPVRIP